MSDREREAFEAWARSTGREPIRMDTEGMPEHHLYGAPATQAAWEAWQARAQQDRDPSEVPWLLRIMQTRSLEEIRDIAANYPTDKRQEISRDESITTRPETEADRKIREWMERRKVKLMPVKPAPWPPRTIKQEGADRD